MKKPSLRVWRKRLNIDLKTVQELSSSSITENVCRSSKTWCCRCPNLGAMNGHRRECLHFCSLASRSTTSFSFTTTSNLQEPPRINKSCICMLTADHTHRNYLFSLFVKSESTLYSESLEKPRETQPVSSETAPPGPP